MNLGSVFKIFTAAQAVDLGLVNPSTMINTDGPMRVGGFNIGEFRNKNYGTLSVSDIIVKSSNRGTGRMALQIGAKRQQEFLKAMGFFEATPFEIVEAAGGKPLLPKRWTDLSRGDHFIWPRFVLFPDASGRWLCCHCKWRSCGSADDPEKRRPAIRSSVMSEGAAAAARRMLRKVVTEGTASFGEVAWVCCGRQNRHSRQAQTPWWLLRGQGDRDLCLYFPGP